MTFFFIFFICYPLAALPLCVLYLFLPIVYFVTNHVVRYRRKVVDDNLLRSFPELTIQERRRIRNRYYWHLSQIAVEMTASFRERQKMRRYVRTSRAAPESSVTEEVAVKKRVMFSVVKRKLLSVKA